MKYSLIMSIIATVALGGCATMADLQDENAELQARIDSLEIANADCAAHLSTVGERMSVLETENLRLDDRNRQLSARVSEVASLPSNTVAPGERPPEATLPEPVIRHESRTPPPAPDTRTFPPTLDSRVSQVQTGIVSAESASTAFLSRYQNALSEYKRHNYQRSIDLFDQLIRDERPNDMIDNCHYWIGEALFAQGKSRDAIARFTAVMEMTGSDKVDDALMMRGNIYMKLGDNANAKNDFLRLTQEFPSSEYAERAQNKLRSLN